MKNFKNGQLFFTFFTFLINLSLEILFRIFLFIESHIRMKRAKEKTDNQYGDW